ncbi:MAG TPA: RNA polymerase sigma factor [Steroidobacteraceae bacterium]|nr:RNA polymerase sigma factor [Steroidobacteraceae bacterium]
MGAGDGGPIRKRAVPELPELPELVGDRAEASAADPDRPQVLAEISRNHHRALVRFLTLRTGSVEDAKEIVQEAYAKMLALDRPGTFSFLAGYLWRIAVNLAIDRGRQRATQERYARAALSQEETRDVSAETMAEVRERLAIVERAIGNLPARCHEAFNLHVLQGLTFDDVGREMSVSKRMAKKHVARALEYLQHCLDQADVTRGSR